VKLQYGSTKPTIHVYYCSRIKDIPRINQLMFGMEEEGVPCFAEAHEEGKAEVLGYKAAENSSLDVGIGIGEDEEVVLHYTKLRQEEPLFRLSLDSGSEKLRMLGANAARLVKGIPFKIIPDTEEVEAGGASKEEIDYLTAAILGRIKDLMQDKGGAGFA